MKIVHSAEAEWKTAIEKGKFLSRRKELGGVKLRSGLWEVPPGKRSFPLHSHLLTEEAMYVVSGHGQVRTPEGQTPIAAGDYVSFPAGGPAHQVLNDGSEPLVFIGLSVSQGVDVVEYPDSGKVAASVTEPGRRFIFRAQDQVGYFDGEE